MKKIEVIAHFGSVNALAQALRIKAAAVYQWGEDLPPRRAYEVERLTNGALKADFSPKSESKAA